MGVDGFNQTNESLQFKKEDIQNIVGVYQKTDILFDIFSILGGIGMLIWVILFILAIVGKEHSNIFMPIVGYISLILICIYTAKNIYSNIQDDFDEKCAGQEDGNSQSVNNDYLIESTNRFYSILSFVYFYVKTYVVTLINIAIFSLTIFILHRVLTVNIDMDYESSWVVNLVNEKWLGSESSLSIKIITIIYLILGFMVFIYIYVSIFMYLSSNLLFDYSISKSMSWGGKKALTATSFILIIIFSVPVLYFNDWLSDLWRDRIQKTKFEVTKTVDDKENPVTIIMYPIKQLFTQGNVFQYINLGYEKIAVRHIRIFLYGLTMAIVFSFIVLPRFSAERLCILNALKMKEGLDEEQTDEYNDIVMKSKQFQARFKFGYFVMIIVVILFHIWEVSAQTVLVSSGAMDLIRKDKDFEEEEKTMQYILEANKDKNLKISDVVFLNALYDEMSPLFEVFKVNKDEETIDKTIVDEKKVAMNHELIVNVFHGLTGFEYVEEDTKDTNRDEKIRSLFHYLYIGVKNESNEIDDFVRTQIAKEEGGGEGGGNEEEKREESGIEKVPRREISQETTAFLSFITILDQFGQETLHSSQEILMRYKSDYKRFRKEMKRHIIAPDYLVEKAKKAKEMVKYMNKLYDNNRVPQKILNVIENLRTNNPDLLSDDAQSNPTPSPASNPMEVSFRGIFVRVIENDSPLIGQSGDMLSKINEWIDNGKKETK